MKFGSICSGIEAASIAFGESNMKPAWFSEIAEFPSKILKHYYPNIKNHGDMYNLSGLIENLEIEAPEIVCGGTPCQAFSLAGWKKGLIDSRGQLTLEFINIVNSIDKIRIKENKPRSIILWENVEGVLRDKTNAFGSFISGLAGLDDSIKVKKWTPSGILQGPVRNVMWRILDSKYFGVPQQRRRLFVIATDKKENPFSILFEKTSRPKTEVKQKKYKHTSTNQISLFKEQKNNKKNKQLIKSIKNIEIEIFREYTDCLYSAYGTKWNGNAAAYNGSLYISQNNKLRRLTPLECERLMGFPDNYTNLQKSKDTSRYKAIGNSWAVPVVKWIGENIKLFSDKKHEIISIDNLIPTKKTNNYKLFLIKDSYTYLNGNCYLNASSSPNQPKTKSIFEIVQLDAPEKFYISQRGKAGILRRKNERNIKMNKRLLEIMTNSCITSFAT